MFKRFHVYLPINGKRQRTTIKLNEVVADLLDVALKNSPGLKAARSPTAAWLQHCVDEHAAEESPANLSATITAYAVCYLAKPEYVEELLGADKARSIQEIGAAPKLPKPVPPKPRQPMGRPPKAKIEKGLALMDQGRSAKSAAAEVGGISESALNAASIRRNRGW